MYIDKSGQFMYKKNLLVFLLGISFDMAYNGIEPMKRGIFVIFADPGQDLQAVFDSAGPGEEIRLAAGDYHAKTVISTNGLTVRGAGADRTRIIWDDFAKKLDEDGVEYNTFRTWTLAVCADGVTMEDLSIINSALHPETKGQEVALTVYGDRFAMERCRLTSTQDTLFLGPLPADLIERYDGFLPDLLRRDKPCSQRFTDCLIEGTVDFIFGCGSAVFDRCEIRSVYDVRKTGYAAAPAHPIEQAEGFVFRNCRFTAEENVPPGSVYLARPWRDHGLCVFRDCSYGDHISPLGFDKWNDTRRDKTARFYEEPPAAGRVPWVREFPSARPDQ